MIQAMRSIATNMLAVMAGAIAYATVCAMPACPLYKFKLREGSF